MPRLFVRPEAIEGDHIRFDAAEARHMRRVLRLGPGARVQATDGGGRLFTARLVTIDRDGAWGTIEARAAPPAESPCSLTLAQAILKGDRMSWLVQKATELGVARIVPVTTARVVARAGPGEPGRRARWERIARAAVKQCGRVVVPGIDAPRGLAEILAERDRYDLAWLFWEGGGEAVEAVARVTARPLRALLLVGPEGGFTPEEVEQARAARVRLVNLGPRILRGESAGIVAVTLGQHLFGDLGRAPAPDGPR
jgi:16S rRNA (uracil1498-N3)-methyltransferase